MTTFEKTIDKLASELAKFTKSPPSSFEGKEDLYLEKLRDLHKSAPKLEKLVASIKDTTMSDAFIEHAKKAFHDCGKHQNGKIAPSKKASIETEKKAIIDSVKKEEYKKTEKKALQLKTPEKSKTSRDAPSKTKSETERKKVGESGDESSQNTKKRKSENEKSPAPKKRKIEDGEGKNKAKGEGERNWCCCGTYFLNPQTRGAHFNKCPIWEKANSGQKCLCGVIYPDDEATKKHKRTCAKIKDLKNTINEIYELGATNPPELFEKYNIKIEDEQGGDVTTKESDPDACFFCKKELQGDSPLEHNLNCPDFKKMMKVVAFSVGNNVCKEHWGTCKQDELYFPADDEDQDEDPEMEQEERPDSQPQERYDDDEPTETQTVQKPFEEDEE